MAPNAAPQDGSSDLVAHPHRFTFLGSSATLAFPPLCANCGQPEAGRVEVSKVFRRTHSDSPTEHVVRSVAVPFCAACTALHRAESRELSSWEKLLSGFATAEMLGAVFPAIAAVFVTQLAVRDLFKGRLASFAILMLLAAFFALIAWAQRRHVWRDTEHLRVAPPTHVSQAFDFGDDAAPLFESARFTCTVRNAAFAVELEALNREHRYVASSPAAQAERRQANRKTWLIAAAIVVVVLLASAW